MKHAILILAHNNFSVVSALLKQFDSKEFDIYIHINKKVKEYPRKEWEKQTQFAKLYFVRREKIGYCDYSMVKGVKALIEEATKVEHDYYHLISGADLLIKKREEFLKFFEHNKGSEFVGFSNGFKEDRVKYKNYFIRYSRQKSRFLSIVFAKIRKFLILLQKKLKISNLRIKEYEVKKGTDWYSITHDAALFLLKEEPKFRKAFYRSYCPTEFFAQTILWNSRFKNALYLAEKSDETNQSLRYIDWKRGSPYVYTINDKQELLNAKEFMFARKFDENKDMEIVNFFKEYVI